MNTETVTNITSTSSDDDDTNITDITILENSTQDNSYNYTDTSQTIIQTVETKQVNIDNSQNTKISFEDNSVVNNINFVSKILETPRLLSKK